MFTCHQAHNIPWTALLDVIELQQHQPKGITSHGEWPRLQFKENLAEGMVEGKIQHFAAKFEATIKDFSATERKKIDNNDLKNLQKVYADDKINEYLTAGNLQDISYWQNDKLHNSDLLEAVKELFIQDNVSSLLYLAQNGVELEKMVFVTYSNFFHYGLGRIKEDCLQLYIHLNILLANGNISSPEKWHSQWKRFLNEEILTPYDGNSNRRMYLNFFQANKTLSDLAGLKELLKQLFRAIYVYDMTMKERGIDFGWKKEILTCLGSIAYESDSLRTNMQNIILE